MSHLKTGHFSFVGVTDLGMKGYVWMSFSLKGSLQSLLSNNDFNSIVPIC